jgi:hypothetical protein
MAENQWQELQASLQHDIRRAFDELRQRWSGIWDQEQLRWNAAVNHYQYAMNQEGQLFHAWVSKPAAERIEGMQQAIEGMREANDTRFPWEAYSGYGSWMSGPSPERRGVARSEEFATELAESSRRTLEQRLAEVETWQAQYTPKDYQYWDAGEEAKQIRQAMTDPVRREAYVQWVVQGAIETGIEEGYPLRDPRGLEDQLRVEEGLSPRVSQTKNTTTLADRLADLLEEAQRQGLVVTGEQSHTEDQKQRQRY